MKDNLENDKGNTHNMFISYKSGAVVGPTPVNWNNSRTFQEALRKYLNGNISDSFGEYNLGSSSIVVDISQIDSITFQSI